MLFQSLLDLFTFCLIIIAVWLIIKYSDFAAYFYILFGVCLLLFHITKFLFFEILVLFIIIFTGFLCIHFLSSLNKVIIVGEIIFFGLWYILLINLNEMKEKKTSLAI